MNNNKQLEIKEFFGNYFEMVYEDCKDNENNYYKYKYDMQFLCDLRLFFDVNTFNIYDATI